MGEDESIAVDPETIEIIIEIQVIVIHLQAQTVRIEVL